jgi:regulator of nonsense transcripts 3
VLEFAPYNRVPIGRRRSDRHQGTIDQEPEFINFLQGLTNPIQKPSAADAEPATKTEKVTTTPLIEHIREKKAAKEKPTVVKAATKAKDTKAADKDKKAGAKATKEVSATPEKSKRLSKAEKAAKEAVKVLNKEAAGAEEKVATTPGPSAVERRRERVANPINIAAKIQRDLGLTPAASRRAKREQTADTKPEGTDAPNTSAGPNGSTPKKDAKAPRNRGSSKSEKGGTDTSPESAKKAPSTPMQPTILKKPVVQAQPPKGPAAARVPPLAPKVNSATGVSATGSSEPATSTPNTPTTPAAIGRQAFLKHANPSQGITEALIEEALKEFGPIEKVEIDRKKGFAYVDFADAESLRKAIAASPVKIAQGAVQVLERRDRAVSKAPASMMPRGGFRGGRGGRGRGGGGRGGVVGSTSAANASTTQAAPSGPAS